MITIQKNRNFFDEVSRFNPKLAHILEHDHERGWNRISETIAEASIKKGHEN